MAKALHNETSIKFTVTKKRKAAMKDIAKRSGKSMSDIMREAIDYILQEDERINRK